MLPPTTTLFSPSTTKRIQAYPMMGRRGESCFITRRHIVRVIYQPMYCFYVVQFDAHRFKLLMRPGRITYDVLMRSPCAPFPSEWTIMQPTAFMKRLF